MRRRLPLLFILLASACGTSPSLVTGPYPGAVHRFYVDRITMPRRTDDGSPQLASDFGDGKPRNQLSKIDDVLSLERLQSLSIADQLAAGTLDWRVELTTSDARLENDDNVGVRFLGGSLSEGDQLGATLHDGKLISNRIPALTGPVSTTITLPLFADADAVEWPLEAAQIELTPDKHGGFDGQLQGAAAVTAGHDDLIDAAHHSFVQMVTAHPEQRSWAIHNFDSNRDGQISPEELANNAWVQTAMQADAQLHDAKGRFAPPPIAGGPEQRDALTVGVAFHLVACRDDKCTRPAVAPRCDDRARNGDESDVDCGGSCGACAAGLACTVAADCLSGTCSGGFCGVPTCSDGRRDGFEIDVDCGPGCAACAVGKQCFDDGDCASHSCGAGGSCVVANVP